MTTTTSKIRKSDGKLVRVHPDGREEILPKRPIRPMTEAEIHAAAMADPDARPMTEEQLATARHLPWVRHLRKVLDLSQEEFAASYRIPLDTLRDWEEGRMEPDQTTHAYLKVIAVDPEGVRRALEAQPPRPESRELAHALADQHFDRS